MQLSLNSNVLLIFNGGHMQSYHFVKNIGKKLILIKLF